MSRYLNSFFISLVLYVSAFSFILYEVKDDNFCDKKNEDFTRVAISVINNQPVVKKDELKQEKKKVVKKKVKKVVKKEPLPVKETVPKKVIEVAKEEPQKQPEKEEIVKEEKAIKKAINTKIQKTVNKDEIRAKQDIFLANLVKKINSNKFYPHTARRRSIQGEVEMKFCLLKSGHVKDIDLVSGKHIFKRSAIRAIEKSFPVDVDNTLFSFPKEFKITIAYVLK